MKKVKKSKTAKKQIKTTKPNIITALPGPNARAVLRRDNKYVSPACTRPYPFVMEKGRGAWVTDVDGNSFLDFSSGIGVVATGHCHPEIIKTIRTHADKFIHMSGTDFYYDVQSLLAEKLAEIVPGAKNRKVFFGNSGAEAVECAMKLARYHTKRPGYIAFTGGFHGRTFGALSLTASKAVQKKYFAPLLPTVTHVPYAYCYRCPFNVEYPACDLACVRYIDEVVLGKIVAPEDIAAMFVEPIQGEGGYVIPPKGFLPALRKLCSKYDILLVDDEVQAGMGRTGRMFGIEHFNTKADIYCVAKGIASGMPISACVSKAGIMDWQPGAHASTFGGNPIACAVALKTIQLLEGGLISNAAAMGRIALARLHELEKRYDCIGDVRGKGLMIGVELVADRKTKEPVSDKRNAVVYEAFKQGLLLLGAGATVVRLIPPLVVSEDEIHTSIDIFEKALKKIFNR
jgi:4-aminobutyrate aminotransferase